MKVVELDTQLQHALDWAIGGVELHNPLHRCRACRCCEELMLQLRTSAVWARLSTGRSYRLLLEAGCSLSCFIDALLAGKALYVSPECVLSMPSYGFLANCLAHWLCLAHENSRLLSEKVQFLSLGRFATRIDPFPLYLQGRLSNYEVVEATIDFQNNGRVSDCTLVSSNCPTISHSVDCLFF
jgi:hypothetical protein